MDYKFKKILLFILLLITIYSKSLLNNKNHNFKKIISNKTLTNKMNLFSSHKKIFNSNIFFPKRKILINVYEFNVNITRYTLRNRAGNASLPDVEIVDLRQELANRQ